MEFVRRINVVSKIKYRGIGYKKIGGFEIGVDPERPPSNGEISDGGDSGAAWVIADGAEATDIFAGLPFCR